MCSQDALWRERYPWVAVARGLPAVAGTCYVWRMMRGASLTTHFEPLHKLRAHPGTLLGHAQLSASAQDVKYNLHQWHDPVRVILGF